LEDGCASTTSGWGAGGAVVTMVVMPAGFCWVTMTLALFPTANPGIVSGVVVVVVVVTDRVGAGGGGAETVCDLGPEAQPAKNPKAAQHRRDKVS
jgi:hypothetical protein